MPKQYNLSTNTITIHPFITTSYFRQIQAGSVHGRCLKRQRRAFIKDFIFESRENMRPKAFKSLKTGTVCGPSMV